MDDRDASGHRRVDNLLRGMADCTYDAEVQETSFASSGCSMLTRVCMIKEINSTQLSYFLSGRGPCLAPSFSGCTKSRPPAE